MRPKRRQPECAQAGNAANYYRNQTGQYPQNLAPACAIRHINPSPGVSIDPRLASGKINGYLYEIVGIAAFPDVCAIEAEPEFPGITGSLTVSALGTRSGGEVVSESFETPGSDEAREEMFNRIRVKAAETVVKLVKLDSSAASDVRSFIYEQIEWSIIATLMDTDGDAMITNDEIRNYDDPNMASALKGPLAQFMDYTDDSCMWGSLSETARANIGVNAGDIELARGEQAPLFSYDGLGVLTTSMIYSDGLGVDHGLREKLEAAKAAEARGDLQARNLAIISYRNQLKVRSAGR